MKLQLKERSQSLVNWIQEGSRPKWLRNPETEDEQMTTCKNCGFTFSGNFCPKCGQSARTTRLSLKPMLMDFLPDIWNLDNRLLRTLVELVARPAHMVRNYIVDGRRQSYYKPIALLFLLTAIFVLAQHLLFGNQNNFHIDENTTVEIDVEWMKVLLMKARDVWSWCVENKAWVTLLEVLAFLLPIKWCFKGTELGKTMSKTEYFYLLVFMQCQSLIFALLLLPVNYLSNKQPGVDFGFDFFLAIWLLKQFFQIHWRESIRRYLLAYLIIISLVISVMTLIITLFAIVFPVMGIGENIGL